jgi:hypothetical protein
MASQAESYSAGHHAFDTMVSVSGRSEGDDAVIRIGPPLAVDCTMARQSPLKAMRCFAL